MSLVHKGKKVEVSNIEVVGLGALNIDHIYRVERILEDGETVVKEAISSAGGSAANTIYGLAKLGVKTGFAGAIGDDTEGEVLLRDFQGIGVDTSQIRVKQPARTGSVVCLSDRTGKRSLYVLPGANSLLTADDLDPDYINQARILHLSSFADDSQLRMSLELMDKLDPSVKVSFSPGSLYATKGMEVLTPILERTHVLFINQNEIQQLTGRDIGLGAESCLEYGCEIVVVTLGAGTKLKLSEEIDHRTADAVCYIRDVNNEYVVEPSSQNAVSPIDTTGAGDAFATGFLYGLLQEKGVKECGRLGDIAARLSTANMGARQGLPALDELSQRYRELYRKEL